MKSLFAIIGFFLSLSLNCYAAQPQDCLDQIQATIDTRDDQTFAYLVDLDSVTESAIDTLATAAKRPGEGVALDPMLAILFAQLSGPKGEALRSLLGTEIKNYILNGVRSGAFAGRASAGTRSQGILSSVFANASAGRKEILAKGEPVEDADGWHMPFTLHDYGNGKDYRVIGRFLATGTGARLVEIENMDELINQIQNEAAED